MCSSVLYRQQFKWREVKTRAMMAYGTKYSHRERQSDWLGRVPLSCVCLVCLVCFGLPSVQVATAFYYSSKLKERDFD